MKRIAEIAALSLVGLVLFVPASAHAASGTAGSPSWLSVRDGVTYESCNEVPFDLKAMSKWASQRARDWGNIWGYYNYELDLGVIAPDGTEAARRTVTREADDQSAFGSDSDTFYLCDGPGKYVVRAKGFWCPIDYTVENNACVNIAFTRAFNMRAAGTRATVMAKKKTSVKKKLTVTSSVFVQRSTGYYPAADTAVALQYRYGKRWVTIGTKTTNSAGKVKLSMRFRDRGRYSIRILVKKGSYYAGSSSKVVKVKVGR